MLKDKNTWTERLCMLITCLLMLLAIAIQKQGSIFGHSLKDDAEIEVNTDTAVVAEGKDGSTIINTTTIARDVKGYAGPTPLKLFIREGRIDSIEVLRNSETPSFVARAKEGVIDRYTGLTVKEAKALKVDAVSGATFSSKALKENLRSALDRVPDESAVLRGQGSADLFDIKLLLPLLVALSAAIIPLFYKGPKYRLVQLICNAGILGLYAGTFVCYASMTGLLANGLTWGSATLIVLLVMAFLYPLLGKRGYYCTWACPLGAAQELLGKVCKRKIPITPSWAKRLDGLQKVLWACLMLLAWTGVCASWMDYEFFSAFLWQSASWTVIILAAAFLLLSLFINRPYCRFVCPTGVILKSL